MTTPRRGRYWWVLGFFVLVALGVVALILANGKKPVRIQVVQAKFGPVSEIVTANSVGTVEAQMSSTISAEISGRILAVAVRPGSKNGSRIDAGGPVVSIDPEDILGEWKVTNSDIATQQLRETQARLRREKLDADYKRVVGTDEPRQNLDRLEKEIEIARTDELIAASAIKTLQAQLAVIERRKGKTEVAAPFAGTVSKLLVEVGELVTPGKPLFTILSDGPLLIRAPIDEVDKPRVRLGLPVVVAFDGYARKFDGLVEEIMATASTDQKNNRTIDIKARLADMPPEVCAGMSAHVEVVVSRKDRGLFLPTHLIHEERGGSEKFVYLAVEGKAAKRKVKTGLTNWETTEILEGLSETDPVVNPLQLVEDQAIAEGTPVEIVP